MIEAYRIGVNLVMDQARMTGPLGAVLEAFERIQKAQRTTQEALNEFASGIRAATRATNTLADAWDKVAKAAQAAGQASKGAGGASSGGGSSGGSSGASPSAPSSPRPPAMAYPLLPVPANGNGYVPSILRLPGGGRSLSAGGTPLNYQMPPGANGAAGGGGGGLTAANANGFTMPGGPIPLNYNAPLVPASGGGFSLSQAYNAYTVVDQLVTGIGRLTEKAAGFNDALERLQQVGVTPADVAGAADAALHIALTVPGRSLKEAVDDIKSLRAVLGESSGDDSLATAKALLPQVEVAAAALSGSKGIAIADALHLLFRSIEMGGGANDPATHKISPEKFNASLDASYKALMVGAGIISPRDLLNLSQQGAIMAKAMGDYPAFLRMMIAPLIDMKGSRAGTAMQASGRALLGGIMTKPVAAELGRILGFDDDAFEATEGPKKTRAAGYVKLKDEILDKIQADMKGGLQALIEKDIRPGLIAHGFTTDEQQSAELFKMAGTDTFRRILSLFLTNADQVLKEQSLYDKVPPPDVALKLVNDKNIGFNLDAMYTATDNFFNEMEKVNAPHIIAVTQAVAAFFNYLTSLEAKGGIVPPDREMNKWALFPEGFMLERLLKSFHLDDAPPANSNMAPPAAADGTGKRSGDVYLDGKKVGYIMQHYLADHLNRPPTGGNNPDIRVGALYPGVAGNWGLA